LELGLVEFVDWNIPSSAFVLFLYVCVCVFAVLWICDFEVWVELDLVQPFVCGSFPTYKTFSTNQQIP
jgi:hypothetical protein